MSISLSKFKPRSIEARRTTGAGPPTIVFIGKRGTGKSTLVADILYYMRRIKAGVAISATEDGNAYYSKFIPEILIHSEYKPEIIQQVITRQKKVINSDTKTPDGDVFVLLDDCMYDKRMIRDVNIRGIFMNGRHWRISFMLTMQYCMDLPPDLMEIFVMINSTPARQIRNATTPTTVAWAIKPLIRTSKPTTKMLRPSRARELCLVRALPVRVERSLGSSCSKAASISANSFRS